jgi:hypothetical protein
MGKGSGLLAIVLASEWLAWREDAVGIVAGAVEELSDADPEAAEGAACLSLVRGAAREGDIVVAGWGIAGAGSEDAAEQALCGREVDERIVDDRIWGVSEAVGSCAMVAYAAGRLAAGKARALLLVSSSSAASVALLIERA